MDRPLRWWQKKRTLIIVGILLAVGVVVWQGIEWYVDRDVHRERLAAKLTKALRMDTTVKHIELDLLPVPDITLTDLRVTSPEATMTVRKVRGRIDWGALLHGRIEVSTLDISHVSVSSESLEELRQAPVFQPRPDAQKTTKHKVTVQTTRVRNAALFLDGEDEPVVRLDAVIDNVMSDAVQATADLQVDDPMLKGTVHCDVKHVKSNATLSVVANSDDMTIPGINDTPVVFSLEGTGDSPIKKPGTLPVAGILWVGDRPAETDESLSMTVSWGEPGFALNDIVWEAPGIRVNADIIPEQVHLKNVRFDQKVWITPPEQIRTPLGDMTLNPDAQLVVEDAVFRKIDGAWLPDAGTLRVSGIRELRRGPDEIIRDIRASLRATNNRVYLDELHGIVRAFMFQETEMNLRGEGGWDSASADLKVTLSGPELGDHHLSLASAPPWTAWQGQFSGPLERAAERLPADLSVRDYCIDGAAIYSALPIDVAVNSGPDTIEFSARRDTAPHLSLKHVIAKEDTSYHPKETIARVDLPADRFQNRIPAGLNVTGTATMDLTKDFAQNTWSSRVDLAPCDIRYGERLRKAPDAALDVTLSNAGESTTRVVMRLFDQRVKLEHTDQSGLQGPVDINLAPLQQLFTDDTQLGGRLHGDVKIGPTIFKMTFDGARFMPTPSGGLESINGTVAYDGEILTCSDLALTGANSDCTVNASMVRGQWRGGIRGQKLDLNALKSLYDLRPHPEEPEEAKSVTLPRLRGTLDIALDEMLYEKAAFSQVVVDVDMTEQTIDLKKATCHTQGGTLSLQGVYRHDNQQTDAKLLINQVDLNLLHQLAPTVVASDVSGLTDGLINGVFPIAKPLDGRGTLELTSKDGNLSRYGASTRVLSILQNFNIFRPRLPSLRDRGAEFNTCEARAHWESGIIFVDLFELDGKGYHASARGQVNYNDQMMDLQVRCVPIEAKGTLLGAIPGIKQIADVANKTAAVTINVKGPIGAAKTQAYEEGPSAEGTQKEPVGETGEDKTSLEDVPGEILKKGLSELRQLIP